jgi:transcriptional regulator with XRE-family HTH domain
MKDISKLGLAVAKMRRRRGLTQHDLRDASGISRTTIAALESGQRHDATSKTRRLLSIALYGRGSRALMSL